MPLGMAVVFAMLASYLLSRTVVPMMANYLLGHEVHLYVDHDAPYDSQHESSHEQNTNHDIFWRLHQKFNRYFERFRHNYRNTLAWALNHRTPVFAMFGAFWISALVLLPFVGQDFFPQVDAGQFRLHVRTPSGTRIEETERYFTEVENVIRKAIPKQELEIILDNIGLPVGGVNLAFSDSSTIGAGDGEILVALNVGIPVTR
ncbi:putative multidrug efflux pump, AcrB/AcrD/AcrF family protein [Calothrix sp. NIES-4071]|nr:putative multidrug efflux pump, AcrB/AcrD/AcrF family protein [Calothrix sp. NIES-4071]BAZ63352.1 putative multidrug efflux pump, AcrB/AcrD/AcrF family protein [Calothrix sp. NIES-4105]